MKPNTNLQDSRISIVKSIVKTIERNDDILKQNS